jgi:hypothetical protein
MHDSATLETERKPPVSTGRVAFFMAEAGPAGERKPAGQAW